MSSLIAKKKMPKDVQPVSPAEAAARAGNGPRIGVEDGFLVLRRKTEQSAEALASAGMTLNDVFAKHKRRHP